MPQPEATPGFLPPRPDLLVALGGQQAGQPLLFGWILGGEVPRGIVLKMEPLHDQQLALEPFTHPLFQVWSSVGPLMDPDVVPFRESEEPETSHAHVCSCCCLCFRRFSVRRRAEPLAGGHTPRLVLQSAGTQPALPGACEKVDPDTSPSGAVLRVITEPQGRWSQGPVTGCRGTWLQMGATAGLVVCGVLADSWQGEAVLQTRMLARSLANPGWVTRTLWGTQGLAAERSKISYITSFAP